MRLLRQYVVRKGIAEGDAELVREVSHCSACGSTVPPMHTRYSQVRWLVGGCQADLEKQKQAELELSLIHI